MKPKNNMAEIAKKVQTVEYENAKKAVDDIHSSITEAIVTAAIPEDVFKEYFLDFFMNPSKYKDTPLLAKWIELAGGPYNEVNIIDKLGNIIYTAPSAIIPPKPQYNILNAVNFIEIASKYNQLKNITSAQGTNYINSVLSGMDKTVHADIASYVNRWSAIFDRYNKPNNPVKEQPKKIEVKNETPSVDIFDF